MAWNIGVSPKTYPAHQVVALEAVGFQFYRQIVWEKTGVSYPVFPATIRTKRARHYKPNFLHEVVAVMEKEGDGGGVVECSLCDGRGNMAARELPIALSHEQAVLLLKGNVPEQGETIRPAVQYSNDIWRIHQSLASRDLKTVGKKSTGLARNGKATHFVKEHPAAFPVELPRALMCFLTAQEELVLDPFAGAFSTLIACEKSGRTFYGIELESKYCDVGIRRWQGFTGEKAVLEGDGRTFDELAAERLDKKTAGKGKKKGKKKNARTA